MAYNYDNIKWEVNGISCINSETQQGLVLYLRHEGPRKKHLRTMFIEKRGCAHIAKATKQGRKFWKRFRLPRMVPQETRFCVTCKRNTAHNKIGGKWKCLNH